MLMGKILAHAALEENKVVTWLPAYGAEVRGGTAYCMVKIAEREIASPHITEADTCCAMNQPSLDRFISRIKKKGLLIINSSLVRKIPKKKDLKILSVPLTDVAVKLGNIKVANTVALGVYLAQKRIVRLKSVIQAMRKIAPPKKINLLAINKKALEQGFAIGSGKVKA